MCVPAGAKQESPCRSTMFGRLLKALQCTAGEAVPLVVVCRTMLNLVRAGVDALELTGRRRSQAGMPPGAGDREGGGGGGAAKTGIAVLHQWPAGMRRSHRREEEHRGGVW